MNRTLYCLFALLFCTSTIYAQSAPAPITTLVLVRHAEKATAPKSDDPELSPEGMKRAEKLAEMLNATPFASIYATPYKRTISTALPLAKAQNITLQNYAAKPNAAFLDSLLQKHAGGTVLVVGHSNTIPALVNMLVGSEKYPQLDDADYNNIFIVSVTKRGNASVTRLTLKM
jgi:2,3-bisphosphoglycerate-dependent phosphoglycerate mutase